MHPVLPLPSACLPARPDPAAWQVYLNLVSNAVRLARTVATAADIPRIASGGPREGAEGGWVGLVGCLVGRGGAHRWLAVGWCQEWGLQCGCLLN